MECFSAEKAASEQIATLPNSVRPSPVTERLIRPITAITDFHDQIREFQKLLG